MHIGSVHIGWPIISGLLLLVLSCLLVRWWRGKPRKWLDLKVVGAIVLAGTIGWLQISPMASDAEMIAYFQTHRSELELLIKRHHEYTALPGKHWQWAEVPETKGLMNKIGVKEFSDIAGGIWLPDPYMGMTSKRITFSKENAFDEMTQYSGIEIRLSGDEHYTYWNGYGIAMKHLVYYPQVPKIEGGWLILPTYNEYDLSHPEYRRYVRVVDSLDSPVSPRRWGYLHCLYRQLDKQWFISLCVGKVS